MWKDDRKEDQSTIWNEGGGGDQGGRGDRVGYSIVCTLAHRRCIHSCMHSSSRQAALYPSFSNDGPPAFSRDVQEADDQKSVSTSSRRNKDRRKLNLQQREADSCYTTLLFFFRLYMMMLYLQTCVLWGRCHTTYYYSLTRKERFGSSST